MPSANRGAFQYGCLSFHCHPIVLTGTSSTVMNRSRIKDILVLFLTAFPLKNDFYHGSFINVLLCGVNSLLFQVRYVVLWWIGLEFFPMLSLHLLRWVCVFPFLLLIWCITFIDVYMLNQLCIPGLNATWSWSRIFSHASWFSLLVFWRECLCLYL